MIFIKIAFWLIIKILFISIVIVILLWRHMRYFPEFTRSNLSMTDLNMLILGTTIIWLTSKVLSKNLKMCLGGSRNVEIKNLKKDLLNPKTLVFSFWKITFLTLCEWKPLVTGEFPSQRTSNTKVWHSKSSRYTEPVSGWSNISKWNNQGLFQYKDAILPISDIP